MELAAKINMGSRPSIPKNCAEKIEKYTQILAHLPETDSDGYAAYLDENYPGWSTEDCILFVVGPGLYFSKPEVQVWVANHPLHVDKWPTSGMSKFVKRPELRWDS